MKTNLIFAIIVLGLVILNRSEAFQEKFLIRAMGQKNFSSSLMSSAIEVARDLKDQTGCLHNTSLKPETNKFVICDFNEILTKDSRCHLINLTDNSVQASGPVAFGSKGLTHLENQDTTKKTLLGAFITTSVLNKKSGVFSRKLVRANGSELPENLSPYFKPKSKRIPASSNGNPTLAGDFAEVIKNESSNMIWVNHSVKHPYDNSCGNIASRRVYESDMNDIQLAEYKANLKKGQAKSEIASQKANEKEIAKPKRGVASEKE